MIPYRLPGESSSFNNDVLYAKNINCCLLTSLEIVLYFWLPTIYYPSGYLRQSIFNRPDDF